MVSVAGSESKPLRSTWTEPGTLTLDQVSCPDPGSGSCPRAFDPRSPLEDTQHSCQSSGKLMLRTQPCELQETTPELQCVLGNRVGRERIDSASLEDQRGLMERFLNLLVWEQRTL
ncbi:unnamed protein product [Pleuronectes platessa]|uniref:Uncharacterized protein n=1 Tax=Pleuronectes platessa TaxID=8262 RepID=A0A9N7TKZ1_PLEPL|nr:unnamed protein product [Pleuronectes platessa]